MEIAGIVLCLHWMSQLVLNMFYVENEV